MPVIRQNLLFKAATLEEAIAEAQQPRQQPPAAAKSRPTKPPVLAAAAVGAAALMTADAVKCSFPERDRLGNAVFDPVSDGGHSVGYAVVGHGESWGHPKPVSTFRVYGVAGGVREGLHSGNISSVQGPSMNPSPLLQELSEAVRVQSLMISDLQSVVADLREQVERLEYDVRDLWGSVPGLVCDHRRSTCSDSRELVRLEDASDPRSHLVR